MYSLQRYSAILLRGGVAFAFLYPPIDSFFHPDAWVGFFPLFMREHVSSAVLFTSWGVLELVIGLWILSGKKIFIPSLLAASLLVLIVLFNFSLVDILFRDIAIAMAAASLALSNYFQEPKTEVNLKNVTRG